MNANHPEKGSKTWKAPIRKLADLDKLSNYLRAKPNLRDYALFITGVNTNLRASDLCALTVADVKPLKPGDVLVNRDEKPGRYVLRTVNDLLVDTWAAWLLAHPAPAGTAPLFPSQRTGALTVPALSRLVKWWCRDAQIGGGPYSSHSLRKTWAYHAVETFKVPFHLVSAALGHRDHETTMTYLGIQRQDIAAVFMNELGGASCLKS